MAPPSFGRSVNPISIKGVDYAHHITPRLLLTPEDIQTFLRPCVKSEQKVARCLVSDDKGRTQLRFLSSDGNEDPMVVGRTLCSAGGGGGSVDWCTGGGGGGAGGDGHGAPLLAKQH